MTRSPESVVNSKAQAISLQRLWSCWILALALALSLAMPLAGLAEEVPQQTREQLLLVDAAVATAIDENPSFAEMQAPNANRPQPGHAVSR